MPFEPEPPHDCRITVRCLKATFGFKLPLKKDFSSLRSENSLIDHFFARRQKDSHGGEAGERISQIKSRPAFKLTSGRMRGATWFDKTMPPQAVVWLLGAELHDERHKGESDAYDILGELDRAGNLFPTDVDYKRLELDRRRWDTESFAEDLRTDAADLIRRGWPDGANGVLAGVKARLVIQREGSFAAIYVAVSEQPVRGKRSGLQFPLTQERFLLLTEGTREAAEEAFGTTVLADELRERDKFPGGVRGERPFLLLLEPPSD